MIKKEDFMGKLEKVDRAKASTLMDLGASTESALFSLMLIEQMEMREDIEALRRQLAIFADTEMQKEKTK